MNAITIEELFQKLQKEMEKGHGDYTVFVSDDEECNGYHALWYEPATAEELGKDVEYIEADNHDLSILKNKNKAIYLA